MFVGDKSLAELALQDGFIQLFAQLPTEVFLTLAASLLLDSTSVFSGERLTGEGLALLVAVSLPVDMFFPTVSLCIPVEL